MQDDEGPHARGEHARISQEAARWLAQFELGRADDIRFQQWRDADPRHAVAFARLATHWSALTKVEIERPPVSQAMFGRRAALKAAGISALAFAGAGGLITSRAYARQRASTAVGESRMVRLPDSSVMALNTDSAASWRFGHDMIELWLERGEIAVDFHPDAPSLLLRGGDAEARLTPGRFNARLKGGMLDLMILRGTASTASGGVVVRAQARHSLLLTGNRPIVRSTSGEEVAATLAWQNGEILFLDEPLASAVEEYNRHLVRKILIADPQLGGIRVGGRFTSKDPTAFLAALHSSLAINVVPSDQGVLLTRQN